MRVCDWSDFVCYSHTARLVNDNAPHELRLIKQTKKNKTKKKNLSLFNKIKRITLDVVTEKLTLYSFSVNQRAMFLRKTERENKQEPSCILDVPLHSI